MAFSTKVCVFQQDSIVLQIVKLLDVETLHQWAIALFNWLCSFVRKAYFQTYLFTPPGIKIWIRIVCPEQRLFLFLCAGFNLYSDSNSDNVTIGANENSSLKRS